MEKTTPQRVGKAVDSAMDRITRSLTPIAGPTVDILEPLAVLASKGKRLRSTLLMMSHAAAGGGREDAALQVAAALELFQVAALVHDDVLDDSDTRRGLPSTHRVIEGLHQASGWRGDAARFGTNGAVLAGDLALMACMGELVAALAGIEESVASAVGERFTSMAMVCTAGQYLDLRLAAQPVELLADEREAILAVMRAKTASYTTVGPLAIGAALAGCAPEAADAWANVGLPLGVAFQLRDDVLGVIGSQAETGKPTGDDLREGKRTLLLGHAFSVADAHDRQLLLNAIGGDDNAVALAADVMVRSGTIDSAESEISRHTSEAIAGLEAIPMDAKIRSELTELFGAMSGRAS